MVNLQPLFEAQKKLDDNIEKNKGLEGQNLLDKKILALQVELGELANDWRGFKYWSENQEPRTWDVCELCEGSKEISATTDTGSVGETYEVYDVYDVDVECPLCEGYDDDRNPLLEEYVDCLHFILSIGNDLGLYVTSCEYEEYRDLTESETSITRQFITMNYLISMMIETPRTHYHVIIFDHITLGEMLGFTWEQVEQAYFAKNEENHRRQENGY